MRQAGGHAFPTQVDFISQRRVRDSQAYRGLSTRTHSKEREMELYEIQKGQRLIECSTWATKTRHGCLRRANRAQGPRQWLSPPRLSLQPDTMAEQASAEDLPRFL